MKNNWTNMSKLVNEFKRLVGTLYIVLVETQKVSGV